VTGTAIRPADRVSAVLARDASLVDVFVAVSPAFERLRNPAMRRVMTRLVTVEQAARIAGVEAAALVALLNAHMSGVVASAVLESVAPLHAAYASAEAGSAAPQVSQVAQLPPQALRGIAEADIVHVDVRDELRAGREPFSLIMDAVRRVPPGGALALRAIFEPVPLYQVMERRGFTHTTTRAAADDWTVWFHPSGDVAPGDTSSPVPVPADAAHGADGDVVILDVRELEQPEPMVRTLEALERLPRGSTLVQLNVRVPRFLLPTLEERGFEYQVNEEQDGVVRLFIRHATEKEIS
jgi:uncharacterized protein (DUF2249 family)